MKLDSIFSFLVPKDRKFFPLFNDAADNLVLASELLIKLVRERDLTQRLEPMSKEEIAEMLLTRYQESPGVGLPQVIWAKMLIGFGCNVEDVREFDYHL